MPFLTPDSFCDPPNLADITEYHDAPDVPVENF